MNSQQIVLRRRPEGEPRVDDFDTIEGSCHSLRTVSCCSARATCLSIPICAGGWIPRNRPLHLEAAIDCMANFGRIALCGIVAPYNEPEPPSAPRNLMLAVTKRLRLQGFIVTDLSDWKGRADHDLLETVKAGRIRWQRTCTDGLASTPEAFIRMLSGDKDGKMLVRL